MQFSYEEKKKHTMLVPPSPPPRPATVSGFFHFIDTDYSFQLLSFKFCFITQVSRSIAEFTEGNQTIWEFRKEIKGKSLEWGC